MAPTANHNFAAPAASGASAQGGQANYKNLLADSLARGVVFGLLALAIMPFVLAAAPAYADDSSTVSISVDPAARLTQQGKLYKATTNVTVKTSKPYGFNLTMQAATADLLNGKDQTHKISAPQSANSVALGSNQWGYALDKSATTFNAVPVVKFGANFVAPAVIADVTKSKPAGCTDPTNCTKPVTFAANIDATKLASGNYSTSITYTATAKPAPKPVDWNQREASQKANKVCRSGDMSSSCLVYLDKNMIPVKYTGNTDKAEWTSVANPEDDSNKGEWYDYIHRRWANAITVKPDALKKYKGQTKVVNKDDILGYWVYIPRYRYKVLRYSPRNPAVTAQNFTIEFENMDITKVIPNATGTWATHPAFTFGDKELNGIWFAKFETTGDVDEPTVLPNERHISGNDTSNRIGTMYAIAKSLGVEDLNNEGGDSFVSDQNTHNLATLSSRMVNNNDWGAATYLSASRYGSGFGGVQINSQGQAHNVDGKDSHGTTGCGPLASYNVNAYSDGGSLGTQEACSKSNKQRAYNGKLGQLASTTGNITGIYDMSGGSWEYTAASHNTNLDSSNTSYFATAAHPPYVNTYNFSDPNSCTFATCGGQALYETNNGSNNGSHQWNGNYMYFVTSSIPWFGRGGYYDYGSGAGLFCASDSTGVAGNSLNSAFRVALAPAPHD